MVEYDVKLIWGSWEWPNYFIEIRGQDGNNDKHRESEHVKDTAEREKLDTGRGKDITWIEMHPYTMTGHRIRGALHLEGTRGTCHVYAHGVPTWAFVAESLKLKIMSI